MGTPLLGLFKPVSEVSRGSEDADDLDIVGLPANVTLCVCAGPPPEELFFCRRMPESGDNSGETGDNLLGARFSGGGGPLRSVLPLSAEKIDNDYYNNDLSATFCR